MGKRNENSDLKKVKLETGTVYQTKKGGNYYFRYQINGERTCVSLKTCNLDEAVRKAKELQPIVQATSVEVISSHVKVARNLAKKTPYAASGKSLGNLFQASGQSHSGYST